MKFSFLCKYVRFQEIALCDLLVEPVCCKKWPKIVPDQLLVLEIRALKFLNGTKLILDDLGITWTHLNQFGILQVLQRSPTPQASNWSGTISCHFLQQTNSKCLLSALLIWFWAIHKLCRLKIGNFDPPLLAVFLLSRVYPVPPMSAQTSRKGSHILKLKGS